MNCLQKQLVLNDGRTMYEHAKDKIDSPLDCSKLIMGAPAPPPQRVSAEEFLATMREIRKK